MFGLYFYFAVPDDVFAQNYIWKGSYNYKGKKQPMTLTITHFNASSGRVNATLTNSNMELLLSGRNNNYKCLYLILLTRLPKVWYPFHGSDDHCKALHRCGYLVLDIFKTVLFRKNLTAPCDFVWNNCAWHPHWKWSAP